MGVLSKQLQIDVIAEAFEANELASDLVGALQDAGSRDAFVRRSNSQRSQDLGSVVVLFLEAWAPVTVGSAFGAWVAMRPTAKVKLSRKRNADGSLEVLFEGSAKNVTPEVLERAFTD